MSGAVKTGHQRKRSLEDLEGASVGKLIINNISMSLDGFVTAAETDPIEGSGRAARSSTYWVFGGLWSYDNRSEREATGVNKQGRTEYCANPLGGSCEFAAHPLDLEQLHYREA